MSSVYWIFFFQVLVIYCVNTYLAILMLLLTHGKYTEGLQVFGKKLKPTFKQGYKYKTAQIWCLTFLSENHS